MLEADHRKVEALFEKLGQTTERAVKTRTELFRRLELELTVHTQIEERILYPFEKDLPETRELAFEAIEEHHVIKVLLVELAALAPDTEAWTGKLKVLEENVAHHVKEEEDELFPKTRKALSAEQLADIGDRLVQEKEQLMGQPPR